MDSTTVIKTINIQGEEIIEFDAQTLEEEKGDSEKKFPYDPTQNDIDIREEKVSIFEYMRRYKKGLLKIDPDYQRNLVWKDKQKSRFIESIMLNFPLPPIYLNQQIDGRFIIIDGLQRTTTLNQFMSNEFALEGLKTLPDWNTVKFRDLPDVYQAKIEDKQLQLYILKPSVPVSVVYELFDRINTGGTPLNRQEVRNCIFEGKSTQLLKELATNPEYGFRLAIDEGVSATRMKDREIILRYLSFKIFDYEKDYNGDLSDFVESAMKKINEELSDTEIESLKYDFQRVMYWSTQFFRYKNFRFPVYNNATGEFQSRGFINTSMFESISYFFSKKSDDFLEKNKEKIISNFDDLLKNATYIDAVRSATGSRFRVTNRFKLAQEVLSNL
jgi:hypothetical protein